MELKLSTENTVNSHYEPIDFNQLMQIEQNHHWITAPLYAASNAVLQMPFYDWLSKLSSPMAFKQAAKQLYYHSATFPKVLGLMLALGSHAENNMMPYYAKHAFGEADHCQLLADWMLKHGLIQNFQEIERTILTLETSACINLAYQLATEQDREKWIVAINCGIERCSNDFFKRLSPKMHEIGAGDIYFDLHVEADEHHSVMGLQYIETYSYDTHRAEVLIAKALEAVSLWAAMLHSWIGLDVHPKFDLTGKLISF